MPRPIRALALICVLAPAARAQEPTPGRLVAVTIDDLPVTGPVTRAWGSITTQLLDALARYEVPAVGFVNENKLHPNGRLDSARVRLLAAWLAAGHELGNHTYSHRSAHATPLPQYLDEIERGDIVTRALTQRAGRPLRYFRHPQLHAGRTLAYRRAVEQFLAQRGYTIAPVTVDNQEWVYAAAYVVARRRGDTTLAGKVVADYLRHLDHAFAYSESLARATLGREIPLVLLLHANELNADHLDVVLRAIRARGYRFAPLDAVLADSAYRSADEYVGPRGLSWLQRWALTRGHTPPAEPREERYVAELAGAR